VLVVYIYKGWIAQMSYLGITLVKNPATICLVAVISLLFVGTVSAEKTISMKCEVSDFSKARFKRTDKYKSRYADALLKSADKKFAEDIAMMGLTILQNETFDRIEIDKDVDDTMPLGDLLMVGHSYTWEPSKLTFIRYMGSKWTYFYIKREDLTYTSTSLDMKNFTGNEPYYDGACEIIKSKKTLF
jgi:hypothetical protein